MSHRVRTRHGVTVELAWSGSGSRSEITPAVERTVHLPPSFMVLFIQFCFTFAKKPFCIPIMQIQISNMLVSCYLSLVLWFILFYFDFFCFCFSFYFFSFIT
ncbi:hypothetical protein Hanom_Chr10g00954121 [Helianthus anomalus]